MRRSRTHRSRRSCLDGFVRRRSDLGRRPVALVTKARGMKAQLTIIPIFMLLLSGAALAQGGDSSILVEVKSASGQPVRNACVTLIPKEGEILFSKADREGRLRFRHVTAGDYRIVVK